MAALALLCALVDEVAGEHHRSFTRLQVGVEAVHRAAALVDCFEGHAARLYAVELNPGVGGAHALTRLIRAGTVCDGTSVREIYRAHRAGLVSAQAVGQALAVLERCGWVRVEEIRDHGRPSEVVLVNPALEVKR